jgi:hypothetical protein
MMLIGELSKIEVSVDLIFDVVWPFRCLPVVFIVFDAVMDIGGARLSVILMPDRWQAVCAVYRYHGWRVGVNEVGRHSLSGQWQYEAIRKLFTEIVGPSFIRLVYYLLSDLKCCGLVSVYSVVLRECCKTRVA